LINSIRKFLFYGDELYRAKREARSANGMSIQELWRAVPKPKPQKKRSGTELQSSYFASVLHLMKKIGPDAITDAWDGEMYRAKRYRAQRTEES
jgi:hypothetical protein